ncbi:MAG: hypothetical protein A2Y84_00930 [Candidatus Colwellbacteria bacterium RBG_13_48_8]|uniref:Bifunctional glucose-6-phosphate/mannose-6-phosphate isomerase C-terminal domain-containing protein n=1 Tax=Candidatus Colwellbacteria bacterium RBG_13_48_8 TaxID=1797685 RepID=A0A1G1YYB0_9BACT|nr:MAG: hypothetical protein A2Y84_00930 [Candidatus Colwellbacteria bacterium RBG_13_48_8]
MGTSILESIKNFPKQFAYQPQVENVVGPLAKFNKFVLVGMGGSGLVGDAILYLRPELDLVTHKDYGLPKGIDLRSRLMIFVSHSGNTEEVLDAFNCALKAGHHLAVVATGGQLLKKAKEIGVLYTELPRANVQPRMALGWQLRAVLKLMGEEDLLAESAKLARKLKPRAMETEGRKLAGGLAGKLPLIYSSSDNYALAHNWKVRINETAKIPAFFNTLPEFNHNEMAGFDSKPSVWGSSFSPQLILLKDPADSPRIKKRMKIMQQILSRRGLPIVAIKLKGETRIEKFFQSMLLADWFAYYLARQYGNNPDKALLIESFKKLLKDA